MSKKYLFRKRIFAIAFMAIVFGFAIINFIHTINPIANKVQEMVSDRSFSVSELESTITSELYGKMEFIELYSYIQVLMDKRECNNFNIIKDENGYLHYASFFREPDPDIFDYALRVKRLQDYVTQNGTKVLFVITPSKYDLKNTVLREGMPVNDPSSTVNELMFYLNRLGVATLNLGETMPNDVVDYQTTYYRTDHHWTIPAAFYATGEIVRAFDDEFGLQLDPDGYYTDWNTYESVTYYGGMLGSMGRRTGAVFSGVDDFTALWPKEDGDFYRESMTNDGKTIVSEGSFEGTFMNLDALSNESDMYSGSQYALYLNELRIWENLVNREKPDGPKMLMIRDSYFSPVISFMMPMCGGIDAIWSLEDTDLLDIEDTVKGKTYDYIVIEVYPYNINDKAFNYFRGE